MRFRCLKSWAALLLKATLFLLGTTFLIRHLRPNSKKTETSLPLCPEKLTSLKSLVKIEKPPIDFIANETLINSGFVQNPNYTKLNGRWQPIVSRYFIAFET